MPYHNMTLDELARHIGMDAREVKRLADKGTLPGQLIAGQWRFNHAALLDWLQREMHTLGDEDLRNLERATTDEPDQTLLSSLIPTEAIEMNLPARSKASALRELVNVVERTRLLYDCDALVGALEEREALCSTALPKGIAFPHPRRPLPLATAEPLVCLARVSAGVPFGAPDGGLTDIFVLICSHDERQHLHTLARIALLFGDDKSDLLVRLRETNDNAEALELTLRTEHELIARRRS